MRGSIKSAKLKVTYDDYIKRVFVEIEHFNPLRVNYKGDIASLLNGAIKLQIQYFEGDMLIKKLVEVEEVVGNSIVLHEKETEKEDINRKEFRADCRGVVYIKKIDRESLAKYQITVEERNLEEKNSIINKIRENIIANSTDEQKNLILLFLIELDDKLNKLISIVEKSGADECLVGVKLIDISGGGMCIFTESKIFEVDDLVYIKIDIKELFHYIRCSAIGKIIKVEVTKRGFFYGVHFEHLDGEFREAIIKFVLEKERLLVREYKLQ
jgi:hypothetical protein